jgi:hypothetical protein
LQVVALNFQPQFADAVATGQKRQTIRRKNRFKEGDQLQLYTGQRTKECRKLGDAVVLRVRPVAIWHDGPVVNGIPLYGWHATKFAQRDGFSGVGEMNKFFDERYGLPFSGWLVTWKII